jgi:DNA-binding NarL/FixJ family response regulator
VSLACPADTGTESLDSRLNAAAQVRQALRALRGTGNVSAMLRRATIEVCETCGFDRAIISRVHRSHLVVESAYIPSDPELGARLLEPGTTSLPYVDHMLIETEMISNNRPILVTDINSEPRTHAGFVTLLGTRAYVAAPIMSRRGIGFLYASLGDSERALDAIDCDRLGMFADSLGYAIDRIVLRERLHRQAARIRILLRSTESTLDALDDAEIELVARTGVDPAPRVPLPDSRLFAPADVIDEKLTTREREVVALMAEGATNLRIAGTLGISTGTAKSHVAHILRKLSAENRADAVARYLRTDPATTTRPPEQGGGNTGLAYS